MPVLQALERLCQGPGAATALPPSRARADLGRQMPWLLEQAEHERMGAPGRRQPRAHVARGGGGAPALSCEQPLVIVIEDLQWSDPRRST